MRMSLKFDVQMMVAVGVQNANIRNKLRENLEEYLCKFGYLDDLDLDAEIDAVVAAID
jgi:hypothetical protein